MRCMTSRGTRLAGLAFVLGVVATGCGGATGDLVVVSGKAFSQETLNDENNTKGQAKVLEHLAKGPPAAGADAVVAVTGAAELTGLDLTSGKTWTYKHPLDHRPQIAGTFVVGQGAGETFVLDASTGAEKFRSVKPKGKMIGAGSDGKLVAITVKTDEGSTLWVLGADGSVKFDKATDVLLGDPEVVSGMAFVPWKNLYVTAFDGSTGAQLATFVTGTETTHVTAIGGALFAGQGRLVRFDQDILKAKNDGANTAIPPKDLPNVTRRDILVGPEHEEKVQSDAIDATALVGRPTPSGPGGFVADKVYGAYYPIVIGFHAKDGKLAWTHAVKDEVIAAHAAKDGVVIVDKGGTVSLLSATNGAVTKTFSLGKPALSADAFADGITIGTGTAPALSEQIHAAVTLKDDRLATVQVYLLEQAAQVPDEETTAVLLEVADSERSAPAIRDAARKALASRTNGAAAMITMLGRHADYLKGTKSPPVGPMAKALAGMKEKKAAGPLLSHLLDPALAQIDLLDCAEAVAALADKEHLPELKRFVNMYRGNATGNLKLVDAIGAIATAILRIEGEKGREFVELASKDALTDTDVKSQLTKVLEANPAPKKKGPSDKDDKKPADKDDKKPADKDEKKPVAEKSEKKVDEKKKPEAKSDKKEAAPAPEGSAKKPK